MRVNENGNRLAFKAIAYLACVRVANDAHFFSAISNPYD